MQYPGSDGKIDDYEHLCEEAHQQEAYLAVAADLLSLALLRAPGEFGADAVIGNSQRFGVHLATEAPTLHSFQRRVHSADRFLDE